MTGRLYGDGAGAAALSVFDTRTFKAVAPLALPGRVPDEFVPDPVTHELYAAFADRPEVAILNPQTGAVRASFPTPGLLGKRLLRFDEALGQIAVVGANGVLDIYDRAGTRRWQIDVPSGIRACDLDTGSHVLACTGSGGLTFVQLVRESAPQIIGTKTQPGPALVALDGKTNDAVVVNSNADGSGTVLERWTTSPPATKSPP